MKKKIYLADLTHTARGIHASTFPLGTAFVSAYAKKALGNDFEIRLFKMPAQLCAALADEPPHLLGCSNYSWNLELGCRISAWAKARYADLIVVFGGPNFPVDPAEKIQFLKQRPVIDFYIENEGEVAFANLVKKIQAYGFDVAKLKVKRDILANCNYLSGDVLINGPIERIHDPNVIPSPYLSGTLDEFFELPLAPMLETTRGCPFSCAFCADGIASKNKVFRFDHERTRAELDYISRRVNKIDELIITDLNFGMYQEDYETARAITEVQQTYNWPVIVSGSAGKNRPERIIKTLSLLKGSWRVGSAMQSSDKQVLKNIKRDNISLDAYRQFLKYGNSLSQDAQTFTEVILALPGDTKEKHFESLRYGIENGVSSVRMYQAILLYGTDMAARSTREKFQLMTKFRVIPGGVGIYELGDERVSIAEIEEIIVGSKDLSFEDYVSCRLMNLFVETYLNNALFEEIFAAVKAMNVSVFDCLLYLHEHDELHTHRMKKIIEKFLEATRFDLYNSYEEARTHLSRPDVIKKYITGALGTNELLVHRALLYMELDDISAVLVAAIKNVLMKKGLLDENVSAYLEELRIFTLLRKKNFYQCDRENDRLFHYDFKALSEVKYEVDPRRVNRTSHSIRFKFFHDPAQVKHIQNSLNLYANTPSGIGRLIQRSNLKKMYRHFEPLHTSEENEDRSWELKFLTLSDTGKR